jgi:hypothetical protein
MIRGSCSCGAVAYEIAGEIAEVHHCHCGICRKSHAAAFSTYAQVERSAFRFARGAESVARHRSSPSVERTFCRRCGSHLQFVSDDFPQALWVTFATIDGDPGVRPQAHLFVAAKVPWHEIADGLPRFAALPEES